MRRTHRILPILPILLLAGACGSTSDEGSLGSGGAAGGSAGAGGGAAGTAGSGGSSSSGSSSESGIIGTGGVANNAQEAWDQFQSCEIYPEMEFETFHYGSSEESLKSFLAQLKHRTTGKYDLIMGGFARSWEHIFVIREGVDSVPVVQVHWVDPTGSTVGTFKEESYPEPEICQIASDSFLQKCIDSANSPSLGSCFEYDAEWERYAPTFLINCKPATVACH